MRRDLGRPLALAAAASLVEAATAVAVLVLADGAYGERPALAEARAVLANYAVLGAGGLLALALALVGAYISVLRCRRWDAGLLVVFIFAPLVLVATTALYGLLGLLGLL